VALKGRRAKLRLTVEVLDILAGSQAPCIGWQETEAETQAVLTEAAGLLRGSREGWRVRRMPDPQAWSAGVVVPDLIAQVGPERFFICAVRSSDHAGRLARIAPSIKTGERFVFVGQDGVLGPLSAVHVSTVSVPKFDKVAVVASLRAHAAGVRAPESGPRAA
jgi:hypothetical protein